MNIFKIQIEPDLNLDWETRLRDTGERGIWVVDRMHDIGAREPFDARALGVH